MELIKFSRNMGKSEQAILSTLFYSDIFDYPLRKEEIWNYLISNENISRELFEKSLEKLEKKRIIVTKHQYYMLKDRQHLSAQRLKREVISIAKIQKAKRIAKILSRIPTILLIAVSGSVSMYNAVDESDIDFFIITKTQTLWITRLAVLLILQLLGKRRKRTDKQVTDRICINLLMDETSLIFPHSQQDLFTAHEIVQIVPLYIRNKTYQKFQQANIWVRKYLPNALKGLTKNNYLTISKIKKTNTSYMSFLNFFARIVQWWLIKRHRPSEIVTNTFMAFYPSEYKFHVLQQLRKRLKECNTH